MFNALLVGLLKTSHLFSSHKPTAVKIFENDFSYLRSNFPNVSPKYSSRRGATQECAACRGKEKYLCKTENFNVPHRTTVLGLGRQFKNSRCIPLRPPLFPRGPKIFVNFTNTMVVSYSSKRNRLELRNLRP